MTTRMSKVFVTFEGPGSEKVVLVEFFVSIPERVTNYESAAKTSLSWLSLTVDPEIDYEVEVCPPFNVVDTPTPAYKAWQALDGMGLE